MTAIGSQEAFSTRCSYHVFLSFRGKDTRKTFIDHLYTALLHVGIRTFRDDDELGRGDDISSELIKAIEQSKISIIVFSKDYATSTWCLDELLRILERKKSVGHMILPVFYHVDPSDLSWLKRSFAEAFAKHEKRFNSESNERKEEGMNKIARWKEALREIANLAGHVLGDGYEAKFIQEIVKSIENKLNRTVLSVCRYPVGLDSRIKDINLWLQDGSSKVGIITIYGMGGIGKTTIAKTLYNLNFDKFEGSSFLANIREKSKEPNGLVRLQRQLLSDMLKGKKVKISNVDEGIIMIKDALCSKRFLLVLDDVDQLYQLNVVLAVQDWIQHGCKILITSRHEQLLKAHELYKIFKVKELENYESLQLFSWHAFGQDHPIEAYMEHSERVVKYCGGLPLALQVLGSSLSGRSVEVWESAIKKLKEISNREIIEKLKISFDSLEDNHDKNLFLDIACFFVGKNQDFVITVLDGCEYYTKVGIDNLIKRCLLSVNAYKRLTMHQLLQDMGREIIRQESPEPRKRSRLWQHKDASNVLREKTGTKTIEGLALDMQLSTEDRGIEKKNGLEKAKDLLDESTLLYKSNWLKWHHQGFSSWITESSSTSNEEDIQTDAFSRMHNLRLLQLNNVRLTRNYKQFPRKLRWLCWRGFSLEVIPIEFSLERLVVLEMKNSRLKQVWKGKKLLKSLKVLNFSHSHGLTSTPDFSNVPNLESLILKDCTNLIEVHESIGVLGRLVLLNLKDCKNLRKLPLEIGRLKSLQNLILSGCLKLFHLPRELGKVESLEMLDADENAILLMTSKVRVWLSHLWYWPLGSREIPESIKFSRTSLPCSLTSLNLSYCNLSDDAIPMFLGSLPLLQELDLSGNSISGIPESIKRLSRLQSLTVENCRRLRALKLPMSFKDSFLRRCSSFDSLNLAALGCEKLIEIEGVYKLKPIGDIDAEMIKNLGLSNLEFLKKIEVNLYNFIADTIRKLPLQGLYECGIFSTCVPGSMVPGWFSFKSTGKTISFKVPSLPNIKIQGFNVCVVYSANTKKMSNLGGDWLEYWIEISNKSKGLASMYHPTVVGVPDDENKDMIWLSHWKNMNQLEGGDEVKVIVQRIHSFCEVKEVGIHVVLEQEDYKATTGYRTNPYYCQYVDDVDLSPYQLRTGRLHLCHHDAVLRLKLSTY